MNERYARQVFDKILQYERFSYREAAKWALAEIERCHDAIRRAHESKDFQGTKAIYRELKEGGD